MASRAVHPHALALLPRVWPADLLFNACALPLQALSLLVLPVFWTLPALMGQQLTLPVAIAEGLGAQPALQRSRQLMKGFKGTFVWPFAMLIGAGEGGKEEEGGCIGGSLDYYLLTLSLSFIEISGLGTDCADLLFPFVNKINFVLRK